MEPYVQRLRGMRTPTMARSTIPVAHLYAILDRRFKELRPAACHRCAVPLPYWRLPPDDVSATLFRTLGLDPHQDLMSPTGRPITLFREGKVIEKLLA